MSRLVGHGCDLQTNTSFNQIQAPGGPDEDTSGGFAYGGWIAPYSDAILGTLLRKQMNMPFDLLFGRKTFDIWAPYWPHHVDAWPGVITATKYVASNGVIVVNYERAGTITSGGS